MNKQTLRIINIVLIAIVVVMAFMLPTKDKNAGSQNIKSTLDIIHERKSVRNFVEYQISDEELTTLVKAGMAAPTAVNKQPWQFLIINDRNIIEAISETNGNKDHYLASSALIVVCGDTLRALDGIAQEYWIQDCSAATQNILLAAESMGLGGLWTGIYPHSERVDITKSTLSLPANVIPLCIIAIGKPSGKDQPKDKWKPELVHWNTWQNNTNANL